MHIVPGARCLASSSAIFFLCCSSSMGVSSSKRAFSMWSFMTSSGGGTVAKTFCHCAVRILGCSSCATVGSAARHSASSSSRRPTIGLYHAIFCSIDLIDVCHLGLGALAALGLSAAWELASVPPGLDEAGAAATGAAAAAAAGAGARRSTLSVVGLGPGPVLWLTRLSILIAEWSDVDAELSFAPLRVPSRHSASSAAARSSKEASSATSASRLDCSLTRGVER